MNSTAQDMASKSSSEPGTTFIIDDFDPSDLPDVTALFQAYAASLDLDLSFQNFADELTSLPGSYSAPHGCLLVARRLRTVSEPRKHGTRQHEMRASGSREFELREHGSRAWESEELLGCVCFRPLPSPSSSSSSPPPPHPSSAPSSQMDPTTATRTRSAERICEMKRLYVRPSARKTGLGRALALAAIDRAKTLGYDVMRLDTLPAMTAARRMYASLGFVETAAYYETPLTDTIFLELKLA